MTEILTESFCERCGTRYTFESARPKTRLKGVKVFSRGLKNFVLSDDTSMDEAMAAARSETDREATAHQLDAFHKTFSFCMSCRQYTCPNCWNEAEARCLSCAPLALPEPPPATATEPFLVGDAAPAPRGLFTAPVVADGPVAESYDDLRALREALLVDEAEAEATNGEYPESPAAADETVPLEAEFTLDEQAGEVPGLAAEAEALAAAEAALAADAELSAEATVAADLAAEAAPAGDLEAAPAAELAAEPAAGDSAAADELAAPADVAAADVAAAADAPDDAAGKAASQTLGLLRRFRPGQNLDAELAAFERERDEAIAAAATPDAEAAAESPGALSAPAEAVTEAPEAVAKELVVGKPATEEPTRELVAALEVPEPEAELEAAFEAAPEIPPAAEASVEPEPAAAEPAPVEPEPAAAEPDAVEPEPAAVEPAAAEPAAPEPETPQVAAAPAADVVEQPTWRITAPDMQSVVPPSAPDAGQVPLQAGAPREAPTGEPQWPARPEWPSSTPAAGLPFLGRPATPQGGIEALWAASNQELVSAPQPPGKAAANSIQPCVSCGLSLSATARFCRRCGTLQGR